MKLGYIYCILNEKGISTPIEARGLKVQRCEFKKVTFFIFAGHKKYAQ